MKSRPIIKCLSKVSLITISMLVLANCGGEKETASQGKRDKLEQAYKDGVLTKEEYEAKKQKVQTESAENKKHVAKLEQAYKDGILTEAEFNAKKAKLLGIQDAPNNVAWAGDVKPGDITASADAKPINAGAKNINPAPTKAEGGMYTHPTGFSFWYPKGWKLHPLEGVMQLVPSDFQTDQDNYETYFITGEDITGEGITKASHPIVKQHSDELMLGLGNTLQVQFRQAGQPKNFSLGNTAGSGIKIKYEADSRIGKIKAEVLAGISGNLGFALAGLGVKDRLEKNQIAAKKMFSSIKMRKAKLDQALVGTWQLLKTTAITNNSPWETDYSRAKLAADESATIQFSADGRWVRVDKYHMIAGAGGVWLEDREVKTSKGKWNADKGYLYMLWDDKSYEDYDYEVKSNQKIN